MHKLGVVSVSFRPLSPEEILQGMVKAGLKYIEWGSDAHAPCTDDARLDELVELMKKYDVTCSSYGSYFRLGVNPIEELPDYLKATKKLGTNICRIWAGRAPLEEMTPEWRKMIIEEGKKAARLAEEAGVILCTECHRLTMTQTKEYALELMEGVNSPNFRTYWQPNPDDSDEENIAYIRLLKPYIEHLHVFYWPNNVRISLENGIENWKQYMKAFEGQQKTMLLEFMYDGQITTLPAEAGFLRQIIEG